MESLPVASDEVKKVISDFINKEGLETVTSGKIRNHLQETFVHDFKPFKKLIDKITQEIIEEQQQTAEDQDDQASDSDKSGTPSKEAEKNVDNSGSDDDDDVLLSTERARPSKKSRKRKASQELENMDLMSSVKSGRRTAAKEAANKLRKAAGWAARKKDKTEKKDKGKITKGTKLVYVSEELQSITGQKFMRRCDVVKEFWKYVRENNRMDPKDKRFALVEGDPALERVLKGKKRVQMFGIMSHLSHRHLMTPEDVGPELVEECEAYRTKLIAAYEASKIAEFNNENDSDKDEDKNSEDNDEGHLENTSQNAQITSNTDSD